MLSSPAPDLTPAVELEDLLPHGPQLFSADFLPVGPSKVAAYVACSGSKRSYLDCAERDAALDSRTTAGPPCLLSTVDTGPPLANSGLFVVSFVCVRFLLFLFLSCLFFLFVVVFLGVHWVAIPLACPDVLLVAASAGRTLFRVAKQLDGLAWGLMCPATAALRLFDLWVGRALFRVVVALDDSGCHPVVH